MQLISAQTDSSSHRTVKTKAEASRVTERIGGGWPRQRVPCPRSGRGGPGVLARAGPGFSEWHPRAREQTKGAEHTPHPIHSSSSCPGNKGSHAPGSSGQVGSRGRSYASQPRSVLQPAPSVTNPSPERQRRGRSIQTESSLECF